MSRRAKVGDSQFELLSDLTAKMAAPDLCTTGDASPGPAPQLPAPQAPRDRASAAARPVSTITVQHQVLADTRQQAIATAPKEHPAMPEPAQRAATTPAGPEGAPTGPGEQPRAVAELIQVDRALESWRDAGFDLNTAVGEIIDNSIEASATHIRIRTSPRGDRPKSVDTIAVSDDGRGIDIDTLPHVLTLGYSSRYGQRTGLGRFGVGLKLAALSQARRLDIYTRQLNESTVRHAWIDLDDIASGEQKHILSETLQAFPDEHAELVSDADGEPYAAGTLVVLNKVDRLTSGGRYRTDLAQQLREAQTFLARAYRRFLDKGIAIEFNGRAIELHDPTFLLDSARVNKKIGHRVRGQLISRETIAVDDQDVVVTVVLAPEELIQERFRGDAQLLKDLHIGPASEGKISFMRQGREINYEVVQNFYPTRIDHGDRYIAVEVDFPAALDEYFQVRHVKKGAVPVDKLRLELISTLKRPLQAARKKRNERWDLLTSLKPAPEANKHDEAQLAAAKADATSPRGKAGTHLSDDEQEVRVNQVVSDLTADLTTAAAASDDPHAGARVAEVVDRLRATIEALPFTIVDRTWPGREMLDVTHLNGKAIVALNHGHPFIRDIYDVASAMAGRNLNEIDPAEALRFARRMSTGLELLFMAYAKAENMHDNPDGAYSDLRMFWGQAAASNLAEVAGQI